MMSLNKFGSIGWVTILAATGIAAAGTTAADSSVLVRDLVRSGCSGDAFCQKPVVLQFTTPTPGVSIAVTNIVGNKTACSQIAVSAKIDGSGDTYFYPASNNNPIKLATGSHTVAFDGVCQTEHPLSFDHWGAHVEMFAVDAPAPAPTSNRHITADVDLYDKPGGNGRIIAHLKKGDAVIVKDPCPMNNPHNREDPTNGWCVARDLTHESEGAVWGEFISK
jgi:hypothetical protein